MSMVPINPAKLETASCSGGSRRFGDLRGVQWRIDLGILPSCPSASIDDLRRVSANSRRRYAALRRQLLLDPHALKGGSRSPDLVMDNPLSQSPYSMWGRFFRNAELERIVDQDLTRLYPERGGYFQTSGCQCLLRRILLLWCLRHPEYGYRQGMHELLAPLLYVLHVDVERLSEVRKIYDDQFADKFDGFSFHESDLSYTFDFKKFSESIEAGNKFQNSPPTKASTLTELDPKIQTIVLLSDAYGAEGELGIVLSEKFMEHDAYSMFESLMSGGALAMSDFFFTSSPFGILHSGYPPVIEASTALYHLLAIVDSSLHTHLDDLGVEPQYFALRWLRVLFGREFSLEDLLVVWDEIFAFGNTRSNKPVDGDDGSGFGILESPRGAFICAFAVSMILNLRSSLLATQNATSCLQRLLNFPDDVKIVNLLAKAKSMHALALEANNSVLVPIRSGPYVERTSTIMRAHSLSLDLTSPQMPLNVVPDSYWEEKWRVLHEDKKREEKHNQSENIQNSKKGWSERVKFRLSRTESDPTPSKKSERNKIPRPSVRRSLLNDLARQLGSGEDKETIGCDRDNIEHLESTEVNGRDDITDKNYENASGEESSSNSSDPTGPINGNSDNENEYERSSVASNSLIDENDNGPCGTNQECSPLPVSGLSGDGLSFECTQYNDSLEKLMTGVKERKLLSGKFQWLWKFGRNASERTLGRVSALEDGKACNGTSDQDNVAVVSSGDGCASFYGTSKGETETVDQNLMVSLKNLDQSILENIQVIESVPAGSSRLNGIL